MLTGLSSWKRFGVSSHLAQTGNIANQVRRIFSFFIDILLSAKFTGRHIQNGCFFDYLFSRWNIALQQLLFQQTYSMLLGRILIVQTQYQNRDQVCEEILRQGKNLRTSHKLRKVVAIYKTNKLVLFKKIYDPKN